METRQRRVLAAERSGKAVRPLQRRYRKWDERIIVVWFEWASMDGN